MNAVHLHNQVATFIVMIQKQKVLLQLKLSEYKNNNKCNE